jgi:purine-binding chemotaxis protein CheW
MGSVNNEGHTQILLFSLDESRYALELSVVEKVVRALEITPLPGAPEIVPGVINFHGRIIPLINVRRRFNLARREMDLNDRLIVARTSRRMVAFAVDSVIGIQMIENMEIADGNQNIPLCPGIKGVAKVDGDIILIYDLDQFLSLDEEQKLNVSLSGGAI